MCGTNFIRSFAASDVSQVKRTSIPWISRNLPKSGRIQGGNRGDRPPTTYGSITLFTMIFYNSNNNIRDIRLFCRPLFCHSSVCEVYPIPLTVAMPLWDLTTKYCWNRPPLHYWLDPPPASMRARSKLNKVLQGDRERVTVQWIHYQLATQTEHLAAAQPLRTTSLSTRSSAPGSAAPFPAPPPRFCCRRWTRSRARIYIRESRSSSTTPHRAVLAIPAW